MYKVTKGLTPTAISSLFLQCSNNRHTRSKSDFSVPQVNAVSFGQNSIRYLGSLIWNSIPTALRNVESSRIEILDQKLETIKLPLQVMQRLCSSSWFRKCNSVTNIK